MQFLSRLTAIGLPYQARVKSQCCTPRSVLFQPTCGVPPHQRVRWRFAKADKRARIEASATNIALSH
ncbi:MAG: hypothetical protein ACI8W8_004559 [Rhodothermales bacterium]|jgi:hypothetical protein